MPVYNVYPEDVVNPIFTNWKITPKKDVVGDIPSECEIRKEILFINKISLFLHQLLKLM